MHSERVISFPFVSGGGGLLHTMPSKFCFICGYYGTHYRVRVYPPFGYSILYREYNLTRFNHQRNTTQVWCPEITLRVQVPNNHILTQNLYYNSYYLNPKYLNIGYMDPKT